MYKSAFYDVDQRIVHVWDDQKGHIKYPYIKYAYTYGDGGHISMFGDTLRKISGKEIKSTDPNALFESDVNPEMRILIDNYLDEDDAPKQLNIGYFDIEIETLSGSPNVSAAENEIISIAITDTNSKEYYIFVLDKENILTEHKKKDNITIVSFATEEELLTAFLEHWIDLDLDIITGWNSEQFDIPYIINRMANVLGYETMLQLSKVNLISKDREGEGYRIAGISSLDYMKLYKNFTYKEMASYSLNNISLYELGKGKVEYEGNLNDLFRTDINEFIRYNLTDVTLVQELDKKLKFIDLAVSISHLGHVPYDSIFFISKVLDGAALTYLKRKNVVAPNKKKPVELLLARDLTIGERRIHVNNTIPQTFPKTGTLTITDKSSKPEVYDYYGYEENIFYITKEIKKVKKADCVVNYKFEGAYVETPLMGRYRNFFSVDLESLYPSIIRSLGISPENKVGRVLGWRNFSFMSNYDGNLEDYLNDNKFAYLAGIDELEIQLTDGKVMKLSKDKFIQKVQSNKLRIAGNGALYTSHERGVIPSLLTEWFDTRKQYKAKMYEAIKNNNDELAEFYDRYQLVRKVLLNAFYGALGLSTFRFYDLDNAEAVTLTGQDIIKFSQRSINRRFREDYGTNDNYVIYSDTDSVAGNSVVHSWDYGSITLDELWEKLSTDEKTYYKKYTRDGREFIHPKYIRLPYHHEKHRLNKYGRVEYIERHYVKKQMFRVYTKCGKFVEVTNDHSIMIVDAMDPKKRMVKVKPQDLIPNEQKTIVCNIEFQFSSISHVEDLGIVEGYVYDIGMKDSPHIFFANDILVHNSVYVKFPQDDWSMDEMIEISGKMETFINEELNRFAKYHLNSEECYLRFKREKISEGGFWLKKKRYAQKVKWEEGKLYDTSKIDYKGLDIVRSSFPPIFKEFMMDVLNDILDFKNQSEIDEKTVAFVEKFSDIPFSKFARTSSVSVLDKYNFKHTYFNEFLKGTPIAAKSALAYNRLLDMFKVDYKHTPITAVDKIKYVMLKENPYNIEVLAYKNYNDPTEIMKIIEDYIDKDKIFEKELENKLQLFYTALKWNYVSPYISMNNEYFDF